jgi:hypothetical protein
MMKMRCAAFAIASSATGEEVAKERVTVLLCVCMYARTFVLVYMNGDGSNKQMLIIVGKLLHPHCLKSIKIFPRYTVPLKGHGMTMTISWSFCGHWIITVQGRDFFCLWTVVLLILTIHHF